MACCKGLLTAVLYSLVVGGGYVLADEPKTKVIYAAPEGTQINGQNDPKSVPFNIRYWTFFENYQSLFGPWLAQEISQPDYAILNDASIKFKRFQATEISRIDAALLQLCPRRQSMQASSVAKEVDQIYKEAELDREQFFEGALSRLSSAGRIVVTDFVDRQVASGISTYIPLSSQESQERNPQGFEFYISNECSRVSTGEYPTELKERMASFRDEISRQSVDNDNQEKD